MNQSQLELTVKSCRARMLNEGRLEETTNDSPMELMLQPKSIKASIAGDSYRYWSRENEMFERGGRSDVRELLPVPCLVVF